MFAAEAEHEQMTKKVTGEKAAKLTIKLKTTSAVDLGDLKRPPMSPKTFHLTSHRRSSSPHAFVISTAPPEGNCPICNEVFKPNSKASRCGDCHIVTHVMCATFARDPCTRKTVLGKDNASCADLPSLDSPQPAAEEPTENPFFLKKCSSLPAVSDDEEVSPKFQRELTKEKSTRSGSVLDEVDTAMSAVEYMIKGDVMWRKSMDLQYEKLQINGRKGSLPHSPSRSSPLAGTPPTTPPINHAPVFAPSPVPPAPMTSFPFDDRTMTENQRVMELLRGGAGLSKRVSYCWPPLMDICARNDYEGLVKLIVGGTDVTIKTENGSTALMVASAYGHADLVELLLSRQKTAQWLELRNIHGHSALDMALLMSRTEVASKLESFAEDLRRRELESEEQAASPEPAPPRKLSSERTRPKFYFEPVVSAMSRLIDAVDAQDSSLLVSLVTETVASIRVILDQTSGLRDLEIVRSNQVMIHLLATLVKSVKNQELESIKPIVGLLVNELKNCMILIQNHKRLDSLV